MHLIITLYIEHKLSLTHKQLATFFCFVKSSYSMLLVECQLRGLGPRYYSLVLWSVLLLPLLMLLQVLRSVLLVVLLLAT